MKSAIRYALSPVLALGLLLAATAYGQKDDKKDDKKDAKKNDKKDDTKKDPTKESTEYYPLKEGMTWTYKAGDKTFTVKVAGTDKKGEGNNVADCYRLETRNSKGDLIATEHVAVKDDGVYRYAFENSDAKPPLKFLQLPVAAGNKTWKFDSKIGGQDVKGSFTEAKEKDPVKVPAGEYKDVVTVTSEGLEIDKQKVAIKYYFAAKAGMVRQVVDVGGTKVTIELEKFEDKK